LWLVAVCLSLEGQTYTVESAKTITIQVPGATAAYALDAVYADAAAENGAVTITGKIHGTTHVVVVTPAGGQPFEVMVTDPPVKYPPGFTNPLEFGARAENGYTESRYTTVPGQVQSQLDFSRRQEDTTIHTHVVATRLFGNLMADEARTQISSAYYEISTPDRDITILDKYMEESPLGITGSILRGVHYSQGGWFLHAGYTSTAAFDGLFLPTKAEDAIEGGYKYALTEHSSLTGSYYYFKVPSTDLVGRSGSVGLLTYAYNLGENLHFSADLGVSAGLAGSARLNYKSHRNTLKGSFRYAPSTFSSLGANNLRGLRSDISWTRHLTSKLSNDLDLLQQQTGAAGPPAEYRNGRKSDPLPTGETLDAFRRRHGFHFSNCDSRHGPGAHSYRSGRAGIQLPPFRRPGPIPVHARVPPGFRRQPVPGLGQRRRRPIFYFRLCPAADPIPFAGVHPGPVAGFAAGARHAWHPSHYRPAGG
jgi:hypothetical protein